jgi:hypothetical protein
MTGYVSKYRTLRRWPWARTFHDGNPKAQQGLCTVAGVEVPHRARWSLKVRDKSGEVFVAACDEHVPPDAEEVT